MAFRIRGHGGFSYVEAGEAVDKALVYLKQSKLAREIIEDLESSKKIITIMVEPGLVDRYEHPAVASDSPEAGTVFWDPGFSLTVIDKAKRRPDVSWVPQTKQKRTIWNCCGRRAPVDVNGELNPMVCLMHEFGHVLQYLSNPSEFRAWYRNADGSKKLDSEIVQGKDVLEQTNTAAIEQPVVLELRDAGCDLGVRWSYYDSLN